MWWFRWYEVNFTHLDWLLCSSDCRFNMIHLGLECLYSTKLFCLTWFYHFYSWSSAKFAQFYSWPLLAGYWCWIIADSSLLSHQMIPLCSRSQTSLVTLPLHGQSQMSLVTSLSHCHWCEVEWRCYWASWFAVFCGVSLGLPHYKWQASLDTVL